jgi:hypothetical protein
MASLSDIQPCVLPFLSLRDCAALTAASPALSRAHRGAPAAALAVSPPQGLSSRGWHAMQAALMGREEYAVVVAACHGCAEPYTFADEGGEAVEAALAGILQR